MKNTSALLLLLLLSTPLLASIPATPVMVLYQFNGKSGIPYYHIDSVSHGSKRKPKPAGTLSQGSSLIPCLAMRNGKPLTDNNGTPYVGFELVVDARKATPKSADRFTAAVNKRKGLKVQNHHCGKGVRHVLSPKKLFAKTQAPFFDPPPAKGATKIKASSELDTIVRAFHNSPQCAAANRRLTGRRGALAKGWDQFIRKQKGRWPKKSLSQARHLDYTMRTTLLEGHLDRGCNAYGACERNTIALSIRNRARGHCAGHQGCSFPGDFKGVSSKVSQYNIWDEFLTQISGLTACFLRDDLNSKHHPERGGGYDKLKRMYAQSQPDVERILFGSDQELQALFPENSLGELTQLRHYYHAPAMGKCFPNHPRHEYISAATAHKGNDYAVIINDRINADKAVDGGYRFRMFDFTPTDDRDKIELVDSYPGFVIDGRKVKLGKPSRCRANGIPGRCRSKEKGRYRRVPPWLNAGRPLALKCTIQDRGADCKSAPKSRKVEVGGACDIEMRPVAGVK